VTKKDLNMTKCINCLILLTMKFKMFFRSFSNHAGKQDHQVVHRRVHSIVMLVK